MSFSHTAETGEKYNPGDGLCLKSFIQPVVPLSFMGIWPQTALLPASCHSHSSSVSAPGQGPDVPQTELIKSLLQPGSGPCQLAHPSFCLWCWCHMKHGGGRRRGGLRAAAPKTIPWDHMQRLLHKERCPFSDFPTKYPLNPQDFSTCEAGKAEICFPACARCDTQPFKAQIDLSR